MKNENTIGIFDSGVGGLSVLKKLIPNGGNYIYFGDTKNLPYGNKSKEQIIEFTREIINFFISKDVKKVIMACNTSSALAYDTLHTEFGNKIKIYPLIQTAAPHIAKMGATIGVLATEATVKSKTYTKEIEKINPNAKVHEIACPDFVKIVENRLYDKKESVQYIKEHLKKLLDKNCDKIVLGCTHYPYLMGLLTQFAPKEMFVDPADFMVDIVKTKDIPPLNIEFFTSQDPNTFIKNAKLFMDIKKPVALFSN